MIPPHALRYSRLQGRAICTEGRPEWCAEGASGKKAEARGDDTGVRGLGDWLAVVAPAVCALSSGFWLQGARQLQPGRQAVSCVLKGEGRSHSVWPARV
jgi:hypothetical protein